MADLYIACVGDNQFKMGQTDTMALKCEGMWWYLAIKSGPYFLGSMVVVHPPYCKKNFTFNILTSKNNIYIKQITNDMHCEDWNIKGRSWFYIDFTLKVNIFTIYTSRLHMCDNTVLLFLPLWSWNTLFMVKVCCIELYKSSYGLEKHWSLWHFEMVLECTVLGHGSDGLEMYKKVFMDASIVLCELPRLAHCLKNHWCLVLGLWGCFYDVFCQVVAAGLSVIGWHFFSVRQVSQLSRSCRIYWRHLKTICKHFLGCAVSSVFKVGVDGTSYTVVCTYGMRTRNCLWASARSVSSVGRSVVGR